MNYRLAFFLWLPLLPACSSDSPVEKPTTTQVNQTNQFDPKVSLKWPSAPTVDTSPGYSSASVIDKSGGKFLIYSCTKNELTGDDGTPDQEILEAYFFAGKANETSRKSLEFGPRKLPALAIESKKPHSTMPGKFLYARQLAILSERKIYAVSVTSRDPEDLTSPKTTEFFDSLKIE